MPVLYPVYSRSVTLLFNGMTIIKRHRDLLIDWYK